MSLEAPLCTVVVRTMGRAERAASLKEAIASIARAAPDHAIETLVVLNGQAYDGAVCEWLSQAEGRAELRVERLAEPSAGLALTKGFEWARGPWVMFLDDDDWLLPDALGRALARVEAVLDIDLLLCNGEDHEPDGIELLLAEPDQIERNPMAAFLEENWLASSAGLYRREAVAPALFADLPAFFEWTLLAFRLCNAKVRLKTFAEPVYVIDRSTPGSLSKSFDYYSALPKVIGTMLAEASEPSVRRALGRKLSAAHHGCAVRAGRAGRRGLAWRHHLASLRLPGGLRYVSFSRRLLPGGGV